MASNEFLSDFSYLYWEKRNWAFATNSNFIIPLPWQPDGESLWHFKFRLFNLTEFFGKSKVYDIVLEW